MKVKVFPLGKGFEVIYKITLQGELLTEPHGQGDSRMETALINARLHQAVRDAVMEFYQCELGNTHLVSVDGHEKDQFDRTLSEAFNSGDGIYRP